MATNRGRSPRDADPMENGRGHARLPMAGHPTNAPHPEAAPVCTQAILSPTYQPPMEAEKCDMGSRHRVEHQTECPCPAAETSMRTSPYRNDQVWSIHTTPRRTIAPVARHQHQAENHENVGPLRGKTRPGLPVSQSRIKALKIGPTRSASARVNDQKRNGQRRDTETCRNIKPAKKTRP